MSTKPKPRGGAGVTIRNHLDGIYSPIRLEELADILLCGTERKVANKNIHLSILVGKSWETIARSSEQDAEAQDARAKCRRSGERAPGNHQYFL